ncbi:hypothetical protein [Ruegeria sp.]|uniref:hypothetical protein n=1 Tax=Ruegeria sp. TaxID=1879320 RepID=UPI0023212C16|nr:hypothetical protein [Ruegeria sp.]MDA7963255.1 hypothetical protein [Ruegeria sp.]
MSLRFPTKIKPLAGLRKTTLDQRIAELRSKKTTYVSHGEALLIQGTATASLRKQRIIDGKFDLD